MLLNKQRNGQEGTKSSVNQGIPVLYVRRFVLEMIEAMDKIYTMFFYFLRSIIQCSVLF